MRFEKLLITVVAVLLTAVWLIPATAEVTVSPLGLTIVDPDGEEVEGPITITNHGDEEVEFFIRVGSENWGNDDDDERRGPRRDDRGGPDELTYEWRDSAEDDGPDYDWIDIIDFEDVVQVENVVDDSFHGMFEIGFDFEYYGEVYDEFGIHANGFACFVDASAVIYHWPAWGPLPSAEPGPANNTPPPTMLAVMYQDLDPLRSGEIFYWTNEQDMLIVTWDDMAHWQDEGQDDGEHWIFQMILTASGLIKYQYAQVGDDDPNRLAVLVGLQNEDRDMGFTVIFNDFEYLEDELAIAFGPEGAWVAWLEYNPSGGAIPGGEEVAIELTIDPEELEDESVNWANLILNFNQDLPSVTVPIIVSMNSPVGDIAGTITDAANNEPIEGAMIIIEPSSLTRFSDDEGNYEMPDMPVGNYMLTCSFGDYFDLVEGVEVVDGEDTDGSMALLHAECNLDRERLVVELAPDADTDAIFTVTNDGNATLTYTTERRLPGDADRPPWALRESFFVGEELEDTRIEGVVFIEDNFYVSGRNDRQPTIYILDREGALIDTFAQPGEDVSGMRDLAYDGTLLWGAIANMVYGLTLEGNVEVEFEGPYRLITCITWDPDRECLWLAGTTTDITAVDINGEVIVEIDRQELRMYGLAYWPDDPNGMPLYIFNKDRENDLQTVHKCDPDSGDIEFIRFLEPEAGGTPVGAYISNEYDIYSWVFMDIANTPGDDGGDRIDLWQLDARRDWFMLDPTEGIIEADDSQVFRLHFNANGLPAVQFEGEIVFIHDGFGRETILPVSLNVVLGPVEAERTLQLEMGWNMISVNLQPDPDDIREITQTLVEADLLILMKDGLGRFYSPEFDFCNIPGWDVADGYQMKMDDAAELTIGGITVMADDPLPLTEGWNLIAYYPRIEVDAIIAFSGIVDRLLIAKDGLGRFYNVEWGFSNMGNLQEGQGYQVKVTEDLELVYRLQEEDDDLIAKVHNPQGSSPVHPVTGNNMSLLLIDNHQLSIEIGVYADGQLVGSGNLQNGLCGIAIWGDDPTTDVIDGALTDQPLSIVIHDETAQHNVSFNTLTGESKYSTDGFWVIELEGVVEIPTEFGITSAFPNPFNSRILVKYALPEAGIVNLSVFDLTGRQVMELASGQQAAGVHSVTVEGEALASGIYFINLQAVGQVSKWKVVLMK